MATAGRIFQVADNGVLVGTNVGNYFNGQTKTTKLANGSGQGAYLIGEQVEVAEVVRDNEVIAPTTSTGDTPYIIYSGSSGIQEATVTTLTTHSDLLPMFGGATPTTTYVSGYEMATSYIPASNIAKGWLIYGQQYTPRSGSTYNYVYTLLRGQIKVNNAASNNEGRNQTISCTADIIEYAPWGDTISDTLGQNKADHILVYSPGLLHIYTFVIDSGATFTLPYLPTSSATSGLNQVWRNGTKETVTSVNTSTGLVTLTAAGTAGDVIVIVYQTAFVASP